MSEVATPTQHAALAARVSDACRSAGMVGAPYPGAVAALDTLGYPTTRQERWRYTRVTRLLDVSPTAAAPHTAPPAVVSGLDALRFTFVAGQFVGGDTLDEGANGCFVGPVSVALARYPERLEAWSHSDFATKEWFAALQAAAPQDGVCILVPAGHKLERPVLAHHHMPTGVHVAQPRHLIHIGDNASAEAVLWSDTTAQSEGMMNAAITAAIGDGAHLSLEVVQDEPGTVHHMGHHHFTQGSNSKLTVRTATACAHWLRNDLHIVQDGTHADSTFHGCYLPNGQQFVDHHTRIDHAHPDGQSDELYKGLAADKSTAVFNGKIMVHKDAQRIEAYQRNSNLLLGEQAAMYAKPELEIYADDVRCSHGCTTGQFDKEALFYLRSRGMTETAANNLLVQAFLAEVLDGFRPEIRDYVHSVYARRLGWS